ncbi:hypothetical protein CBS101457_003038 [Exobasidium rhododendri]|nr:hypothetical protein CBS101457_003038 [Exobasidium rhododendri]
MIRDLTDHSAPVAPPQNLYAHGNASSNLFAQPPMYSREYETYDPYASLENSLASMSMSDNRGHDVSDSEQYQTGGTPRTPTYSVQQREDQHRQLQDALEIASTYHGETELGSSSSSSSRRRRRSRQVDQETERRNRLVWARLDYFSQQFLLNIVSKRRGITDSDASGIFAEKLTQSLEDDLRSDVGTRVDLALRRMIPFSDRYKVPIWMNGLSDDECDKVVSKLQEVSTEQEDIVRNRLCIIK